MKFNVAQLLLGPTGGFREYDLDDDINGLDPQIVPYSPLAGHVKFTHAGPNVLVEGRVGVDLELTCARCTDAFIQRVVVDILEEFEPSVDLPSGRVLPDEHEDSALVIDKHNMLDLREVVRQDLLLAMEEHLHCREGCDGLCPECGAKLSEGPCGCGEEHVDPRWEALADLQGKLKS